MISISAIISISAVISISSDQYTYALPVAVNTRTFVARREHVDVLRISNHNERRGARIAKRGCRNRNAVTCVSAIYVGSVVVVYARWVGAVAFETS